MQQLTVTSLVRYLKNKLDTDNNLQRIFVSGEISNYHRHYSGHLYFTLKDENSAIDCVMFKSYTSSLTFEPKTGDKVILCANTSIFEISGKLQLYVLKISLDGLGDLYAKYEALKKRLSEDGYFDNEHKKQLTKTYLDNVAILVGDQSAAMSDIKTMFNRRWPLCKVDYYPVLVQGNDAPLTIISKLKEVDEKGYDAIILARGGGSFEDLFCFNDEELVKTIYNLKTFIITGVGHEQDFTLVDFVADLRAPTPTAAVELITPNLIEVIEEIDELNICLKQAIENKLNNSMLNFDYGYSRLMKFHLYLNNLNEVVINKMNKIINLIKNQIILNNENINHNLDKIKLATKYKLDTLNLNLKRLNTLLDAYSLENSLKRGYTLVIQNDKVVKNKKELLNKEFEVKFNDGSIKAIER